MSQRVFHTDKYEVLAGWDNPLRYFFLVIERLDAKDEDEDEGYAFSNLTLKNPAMTFDQVKAVLKEFQITPPETFYVDLEDDRISGFRGRHVYEQSRDL